MPRRSYAGTDGRHQPDRSRSDGPAGGVMGRERVRQRQRGGRSIRYGRRVGRASASSRSRSPRDGASTGDSAVSIGSSPGRSTREDGRSGSSAGHRGSIRIGSESPDSAGPGAGRAAGSGSIVRPKTGRSGTWQLLALACRAGPTASAHPMRAASIAACRAMAEGEGTGAAPIGRGIASDEGDVWKSSLRGRPGEVKPFGRAIRGRSAPPARRSNHRRGLFVMVDWPGGSGDGRAERAGRQGRRSPGRLWYSRATTTAPPALIDRRPDTGIGSIRLRRPPRRTPRCSPDPSSPESS